MPVTQLGCVVCLDIHSQHTVFRRVEHSDNTTYNSTDNSQRASNILKMGDHGSVRHSTS